MAQTKYFSQYAEAEVQLLAGFPAIDYQQLVCIPAFAETPAFLTSLRRAANNSAGRTLLILVVNQPEDHDEETENHALAGYIEAYFCRWQQQHLSLHALGELDVLLVKRFNKGLRIPRKQGVGLARKIAADIAACLIVKGQAHTAAFFCSDADVIFPNDYFSAHLPAQASAGVFHFEHKNAGDHAVDLATHIYQRSLQHYVEGLQRAGSPYAFHTIGSCLLINSLAYLQVRGFPKRAGGEDFYLLNKLNKQAPVVELPQSIAIRSRQSLRVPFGTGPAISRLMQAPEQQAIFYHPQCFDVLHQWLRFLNELAEYGSMERIDHETAMVQALAGHFDLTSTVAKLFHQHKTATARRKNLHDWFDAFKTLKLIHQLRDQAYPSLSLQQLQALCQTDG